MAPTIGISGFETGSNPVKPRLFSKITDWAEVRLFEPEVEHPDILDHDLDLYHMARRRRASLSDFERVHRGGVPTINPYERVKLVIDRINCLRMLEKGGLSVPDYRYGRADEIALDPPVIVKPRYELGPDRHEFSLVADGDIAFEDRQLVQRYVPHERSIKIYYLGDVIKAVDGNEGVRQPTRECTVTRRLDTVADAIAECTGLCLFEADLVESNDLFVVDVNPVVSLRGIMDGCSVYERLLKSRLDRGDSVRV